jgi:BirA family biotin operon repressor/biotin-[acetyl-CoA-carboxylase] ligase
MNPREEWHENRSHLGRRVLQFDRLDSTNTFALGHADDPANDGLVVMADQQTAGRGQHGRTWTCPDGGGVLMSVLLFPPLHLGRPAILTAWAAVSVGDVIFQATGLETTIKWPNDVLVQGRKVCGILIEQSNGVVVGIGVNVNQPIEHFDVTGLTQAASLAMLAKRQFACRSVSEALIDQLDTEYHGLIQGRISVLQSRWQQRVGLVNEHVAVETTTDHCVGTLHAMTFAALEVALSDGTVQRIVPEAVKHIWRM